MMFYYGWTDVNFIVRVYIETTNVTCDYMYLSEYAMISE